MKPQDNFVFIGKNSQIKPPNSEQGQGIKITLVNRNVSFGFTSIQARRYDQVREPFGKRRVLLHEGWHSKSDDVPEKFNFTDPVETVFMNSDVIVPGTEQEVISRKGQTLDRDVFEAMRKEFYDLRGEAVVANCRR